MFIPALANKYKAKTDMVVTTVTDQNPSDRVEACPKIIDAMIKPNEDADEIILTPPSYSFPYLEIETQSFQAPLNLIIEKGMFQNYTRQSFPFP